MGYSEIYCMICGVSFNISRVRTADEPRTAAWRDGTNNLGQSWFIPGYSHDMGCNKSTGCMLAHREDNPVSKKLEGHELDIAYGLVSKGHDDDDDDDDYMPGDEEDEMLDIEPYEWSTPPESSAGDSDLSMEDGQDARELATSVIEDPEELLYQQFCQSLNSDQLRNENLALSFLYRLSETKGPAGILEQYVDFIKPRFFADHGTTQLQDWMEPVKSREDFEQDDAELLKKVSDHFGKNFEADSKAYARAKREYQRINNLSFWRHSLDLEESERPYDPTQWVVMQYWEHIAGPDCQCNGGYSGHRIGVEEMHGSNTLQCLLRRPYQDDVEHDEDWERTSGWSLSGLADFAPSRDMDYPSIDGPRRHATDELIVDNVMFMPEDRDSYAIPFHPTCLEVYKRACLKRWGQVDVPVLASWWNLNSDYEDVHSFPRDPAVDQASEQWWQHNIGDEFLAANPCFVPELDSLLGCANLAGEDSAEPSSTACPSPQSTTQNHLVLRTHPKFTQTSPPDLVSRLSAEIRFQICSYLTTVEIAYLSQAVPSLHDLPQSFFKECLMQERPYLWELWCNRPYSCWVGVTASDIKRQQKLADTYMTLNQHTYEHLKKDDQIPEMNDMDGDDFQTFLSKYFESQKQEVFGRDTLRERPAIIVDEDRIDFAKLAIEIELGMEDNRYKGLRNRARIWKDCGVIIDQIEDLRSCGKITKDGKVRDEASL